jgi:GTPase
MANVKNLKKDINYVLDIIEAVYLFEISTTGKPTTETNDLIDEAIAAFDVLITKVNAKNVENKKHISNKSMLNWNKLQIN